MPAIKFLNVLATIGRLAMGFASACFTGAILMALGMWLAGILA